MRKLIIVVASLLVVVLFILQGFQQTHPLPDNNRQSTATGEGIADALDAIYFDVSIMGVQDATAERLASDFGVDTSCLSAVYGRYTDGRFGIADVILVVPKPGQEASARDLLVTIRTSRAGFGGGFSHPTHTLHREQALHLPLGGLKIQVPPLAHTFLCIRRGNLL